MTNREMDRIVLDGEGPDRTLGLERGPVPEPGHGEVRIEVQWAGICGSDVGAWMGKSAYDFVETPRVLGHEYAGVVDAVGPGVDDIRPGERVVERPLTSCGRCTACRNGAENVCEDLEITGFHTDGGFAPYSTVASTHVHSIPDSLQFHTAAMVEPLSVAARAVIERGQAEPGDSVLVVGPGPMGAFAALIVSTLGASVVVGGLPQDSERFHLLESVDIDTADLTSTSPRALASDTRSGAFDLIIDATGSAAVLEDVVGTLRPGGAVVVVGIPSGQLGIPSPAFVRSENRVSASYGALPRDFERSIRLLQGDFPIEKLVTEFDPREPAAAFDAFASGTVIKPLLAIGDLQ